MWAMESIIYTWSMVYGLHRGLNRESTFTYDLWWLFICADCLSIVPILCQNLESVDIPNCWMNLNDFEDLVILVWNMWNIVPYCSIQLGILHSQHLRTHIFQRGRYPRSGLELAPQFSSFICPNLSGCPLPIHPRVIAIFLRPCSLFHSLQFDLPIESWAFVNRTTVFSGHWLVCSGTLWLDWKESQLLH